MIMRITTILSWLLPLPPFCSHLWPLLRSGHKWLQSGVIDNNPSKMNVIPLFTFTLYFNFETYFLHNNQKVLGYFHPKTMTNFEFIIYKPLKYQNLAKICAQTDLYVDHRPKFRIFSCVGVLRYRPRNLRVDFSKLKLKLMTKSDTRKPGEIYQC